MATCEDSHLKFIQTLNNSFYFKGTSSASCETELHSDNFRRCEPPISRWIQSKDQKFLVLRTSGKFEFEDRTVHDRGQPDCKFEIQIYQDSGTNKNQAVMLYVCADDEKIMLSCKNNKEVCPEPMDCEVRIEAAEHKALFRWKRISTGKYMFESTKYPGYFLAFEHVEDMPCLHKLILRQESMDEVDESRILCVNKCSP
ncbi:interleukin-18-like isoform X2 [Poeciliopsis prolifica]|nr:interleukin-18-like isoform X2 [Poeciliopsis prolifica]XP_054881287.1 interleukin-18-like isoform X2 [Poeciliopsis prolifica]